MGIQKKILAVALSFCAVLAVVFAVLIHGHPVPILQPAGPVSGHERSLIIFTLLLSAAVVIPVFSLLIFIAFHYREGNPRAGRYDPELAGNAKIETIWWIIPAVMIMIIGITTWRTTYALDPFKPLPGGKPLHIQVVALDWKWLFIYPDQNMASINEAAIPANTPVDFDITSDAVMTSFWAPQLAGQMYAMPGMNTKLNLLASKDGIYRGQAANISGEGFAGMGFTIRAMTRQGFNAWVTSARRAHPSLTSDAYASLERPSSNVAPSYYSSVSPGLYDTIMMKYMMPTSGGDSVDSTTQGTTF